MMKFEDHEIITDLYGERDENLRYIEERLGVEINARANQLSIEGKGDLAKNTEQTIKLFYNQLKKLGNKKKNINIRNLLEMTINLEERLNCSENDKIFLKTPKKIISAANKAQLNYINILSEKEITFATGPAGTGKTYIAVAVAVTMLLSRRIDRIILSRPAVEAGEKIGFLPGDIKDKIDPYLHPLYDALGEMLDRDYLAKSIENHAIEIAPLAFMRGRSFNNAFVILDEAQNTSVAQMKMFLTRIGNNSRMAIIGDIFQNDLGRNDISGLADGVKRLKNIEEIGFQNFSTQDIIRNKLISKILDEYEK